jgi:pimeloyl-ACP methyl ester carboxylesterase
MARVILVHGAFSGGWGWAALTPLLEAAGHTVQAPDLPGSGADETPPEEVTLDGYADRIAEALADGDEPAVLVGHSMGGCAITHAAGRDASQIRQLVYVCAFLPPDGRSLLDMTRLPEGAGDQIQANMVVQPPIATLTDEGARLAVYNNCTEEQIAAALPRRGAQALAPMGTPVARGDHFDEIPRAYVVCTRDQSIPPPLQRRMIADDGHVSPVFELDTDHAPMLSKTAELAAILDQVASGQTVQGP